VPTLALLSGATIGFYMPYFICPNCRQRVVDDDRRDGLSHQPVGCSSCGFGFLFELLEDYFPRPGTGMIVCGADRRILALGRGVFELSGYQEKDVLGKDFTESVGLSGFDGQNPVEVAIEWGVRQLDQRLTLRTKSGTERGVVADLFPAYDEDGGLLIALAPG
jgi:PAS domain-containing protein